MSVKEDDEQLRESIRLALRAVFERTRERAAEIICEYCRERFVYEKWNEAWRHKVTDTHGGYRYVPCFAEAIRRLEPED